MSVGDSGTFAVQLCLQQLVFVGQLFVCQQVLMVQLGPFVRARLKRASVSVIYEDSRRVIFTRPSFNYSTRISGTGDKGYLLLKKLTESSLLSGVYLGNFVGFVDMDLHREHLLREKTRT